MRSGAILAGATVDQLAALTKYADAFGLTFQITDDILDVVGDEATIGKPVGSDEENEKVDYGTKVGADAGRELVSKLTDEALSALDAVSADTAFLKELAVGLSHRVK